MSTTSTSASAERVIALLRAHEEELRSAGIRHLSLFGSVARDEALAASDLDLVVELNPEAHIGLFALGALERRLTELVGRPVDLLPEPIEGPRLRASINRDRRRAF
jgi:predicted nucleotidyltransferase